MKSHFQNTFKFRNLETHRKDKHIRLYYIVGLSFSHEFFESPRSEENDGVMSSGALAKGGAIDDVGNK